MNENDIPNFINELRLRLNNAPIENIEQIKGNGINEILTLQDGVTLTISFNQEYIDNLILKKKDPQLYFKNIALNHINSISLHKLKEHIKNIKENGLLGMTFNYVDGNDKYDIVIDIKTINSIIKFKQQLGVN